MRDFPSRVFLVGPMAAGKSTVGKYLAELLDYAFFDTDKEIEKQTGASIAWIFEKEGEVGFRKRETNMLEKLTQLEFGVIATGGGAVISELNREYLHSRGLVVYIKADADIIIKRTARDKSRPLLQQKNRKKVIRDLLNQRECYYSQVADVIVETQDTSAKDMARTIFDEIDKLSHAYLSTGS